MQRNESGFKTLPTGVAMGRYLRTKIASGVLALAGESDSAIEIGVTESISLAVGESQTVKLRSAPGSNIGIASAAIVAGVALEPAANGKFATKSAGVQIAIALTAAGADGDQFEFMYI